jgi:hypothetical protein
VAGNLRRRTNDRIRHTLIQRSVTAEPPTVLKAVAADNPAHLFSRLEDLDDGAGMSPGELRDWLRRDSIKWLGACTLTEPTNSVGLLFGIVRLSSGWTTQASEGPIGPRSR